MPRKEVYCETCKSDQPLVELKPELDELNPYRRYDLMCDYIVVTPAPIKRRTICIGRGTRVHRCGSAAGEPGTI